MFRYFKKIVDESTMQNERERILRLASYLDKIKRISQSEKKR